MIPTSIPFLDLTGRKGTKSTTLLDFKNNNTRTKRERKATKRAAIFRLRERER